LEQDRTGSGGSPVPSLRFRFGEFELDPAGGRLWRRGAEIGIRPKPLALLEYLIRHRERVVSREELRDAVWEGLAVSDAAVASAVRDARRALGDDDASLSALRSLRGAGFRFVAEVEELDAAPARDGLVGRHALLQRMEHALAAVRRGEGRLLWLAGEAGIGKTRLLLELARRGEASGIPAHFGGCLEEEGAAPYRPWQQLVRSLVSGIEPERVTALFGAFAAEAQRLLPEREAALRRHPPPPEDGEGQRLRLFDAVVELVRAASRDRPVLLALDDIHRADDATLRLLVHLVRELPRVPVLLIAAYRPGEVDDAHPLAKALEASEPGVEHLGLDGLAEKEVAMLAGAILGRRVSPETERALWRRTAGNPLFVGEIARALAEAPSDGAHAELAASVLPVGVRQAIRARLAKLPGGARELLETASVIGREFDLDLLRAVRSGVDADADGRTLENAAATGLLERPRAQAGRLRFAHILVRDALYEAVAPLRRLDLHAAVGRALERLRSGHRTEYAADLAHHFAEAASRGEAERCVQYARIAGERALEQAAYREAARLFESALRGLAFAAPSDGPHDGPEGPQARRASLLVLLGRARWRHGENDAAREAFREAGTLARQVGAADLLARAALGYAGRTDASPAVDHAAVELLEQALSELADVDSALRTEVLARLGTELYYGVDPARCDALTRSAVAMAERIGDPELLAYSLSARCHALLRPDVEPQRRLAICERQLGLAREGSEVHAISLQGTILCLLEQGDAPRLDEALLLYDRLARELRQPFFRWMASVFEGTRAFLGGRIEEALRIAQQSFEIGQAFGTPNAFARYSVQLLFGRREQGRMGELEPALRELAGAEPAFKPFRSALPPMYLELGRPREARDVFEQLMARDLDDVPRDQHWIPVLAMLTAACAPLRDEERAGRLYSLLAPCAGRLVIPGYGAACDGAVDHHLARLAETCGDLDAADEHYDAAVTLERRAGARLFCAHSQRRWAALLWKRGLPRERDQAREHAAEAASAYRALDLEPLARRAEAVVGG
jgi:DNA-binding winged helix-turn-helix (wHTH) protein/tetratricopeptide (TPR) repeat protein